METEVSLPSQSSPPPLSSNAMVNEIVSELFIPHRPPSWKIATSLLRSFQYAGVGFLYACRTQRNFRIHLVIAILAVNLGLLFHLRPVEMALISLTCGLVLSLELLNTALEAVVDLTVGREYHHLAKIAKDCAAAAVMVSALVSLTIAGWLLLPPFWTWFQAVDPFSQLF